MLEMVRPFERFLRRPKPALIASGVLVFGWLVGFWYQTVVQGWPRGDALILSLADTAGVYLALSLLAGPFSRFFREFSFLKYRRMLGIWGFAFGALHGSVAYVERYLQSGLFFDLSPIRNPVLFGLTGLVVLIPVFLTSTDWMIVRLGGRRWKTVQKLVYLAIVLILAHILLIAREPRSLSFWIVLVLFVGAIELQIVGRIRGRMTD